MDEHLFKRDEPEECRSFVSLGIMIRLRPLLMLFIPLVLLSCGSKNSFTKKKYLKLKSEQVFGDGTEENRRTETVEFETAETEALEIEELVENEEGAVSLGQNQSLESSIELEKDAIIARLDGRNEEDLVEEERNEETAGEEDDNPYETELTKYETLTERYIRRSRVMAAVFGVWAISMILILILGNPAAFTFAIVLLSILGFILLTTGFVFALIGIIAQKQWRWYARLSEKKYGYDISKWERARSKTWIWFSFFAIFFGIPVVTIGLYISVFF